LKIRFLRSSIELFSYDSRLGFLESCCFKDKVGIISMFTGIAGLELGMSKPEPQTLKVDIAFTSAAKTMPLRFIFPTGYARP